MKEYLGSFLVLSAVISVGMLLSYRENDKALRFAFSVIFCAAVMLPLCELTEGALQGGITLPTPPALDGEGEYERVAEGAYLDGARELLRDEFDIADENIELEGYGFDFEKMRFSSLVIRLYGSSVFSDISDIEGFARENFGGCDVKIRLG